MADADLDGQSGHDIWKRADISESVTQREITMMTLVPQGPARAFRWKGQRLWRWVRRRQLLKPRPRQAVKAPEHGTREGRPAVSWSTRGHFGRSQEKPTTSVSYDAR
jgi:hypothetical protein